MSCNNNILVIYRGDSKNLGIVITKDKIINKGFLNTDIPTGVWSSTIDVVVQNPRNIIPGNGHLILKTQAGEVQTIEYNSVSIVDNIYRFVIDPVVIDYKFYIGYDISIDGGRVDISADTITFTATDSSGATVINKNAVIATGDDGIAVISLTTTDTDIDVDEYSYKIVWVTSGGGEATLDDSIMRIKL
jgi:hypothetical protein